MVNACNENFNLQLREKEEISEKEKCCKSVVKNYDNFVNSKQNNYVHSKQNNLTDEQWELWVKLAKAFKDNHVKHVPANNILRAIKTHPCLSFLPSDTRALLDTPRDPPDIATVEPGEYLHLDLEKALVQILDKQPKNEIPEQLVVDIHTDGATLNKKVSIWPIQCRIVNVRKSIIGIIGIYQSRSKPLDPNEFFNKFILESNKIKYNGGILYNNNKTPIVYRCFIADALARAFILRHKNHRSYFPCSKC